MSGGAIAQQGERKRSCRWVKGWLAISFTATIPDPIHVVLGKSSDRCTAGVVPAPTSISPDMLPRVDKRALCGGSQHRWEMLHDRWRRRLGRR